MACIVFLHSFAGIIRDRDIAVWRWVSEKQCFFVVPLLAAWEGLLFLNEPFSARMALSAAGILGGIFLTSFANRPRGTQKPS